MGAGIYWFAASRRAAGWNDWQIVRRTAIRGLALFGIAQVLEVPVLYLQSALKPAAVQLSTIAAPPPNDGSALAWGFITMSGLSLAMVVCAFLLRVKPWMWLAVSAGSILATHTLLPAEGRTSSWLYAVLLAPGLSRHLLVLYPVIPWLAGATAGMFFAYWWRQHRETFVPRIWMLGLAVFATGIGLRAAGGVGNLRLPRDGSWIEFLNNVKYPPSLVFWTLFLGLDLLILSLLIRAPESWKSDRSPLIVFGQTPLFFYYVHFYVLWATGWALFPEAGSLEVTYLVWIVMLIALYPVCAWYRRFKLLKPADSIWRLF